MVGVFKRSFSVPSKHHSLQSSPPITSHHIRSVSLPCRSHPLISQLKDEITDLKTRASKPDNRTSAWLCDALSSLKVIHNLLDDILQLPQSRESLTHKHDWVEKLLEDFLRFVDVYGIFQTSVLALKETHYAAQVAIRKKDDSKSALHVEATKKMAREMGKLTSTIRCIGKYTVPGSVGVSIGDADQLGGIISDVIEVTVLVSLALFNGVSLLFVSRKSSWMGLRLLKLAKRVKVDEGIQEFQQFGVESLWGLKKKGDEEVWVTLKRMKDLAGCIDSIELVSEKVFRSLIRSRVSLLNALTQ
ncbi:DUF241 domain-containing protein [Cephalotus follicularis]|uniref:DUF241 domain-containing protein n=1 Tax=Cephalotus follicularis TaxID=3775 RepID=A0A1Q3B6H2_CEPFO|nr:DUF241 domain-containing protein [Cephalotus follicularis]